MLRLAFIPVSHFFLHSVSAAGMGVGGRRRRCTHRSRSADTDEPPGEPAGGGCGCSRTAGLEASEWWGSSNVLLRMCLGKCWSRPLRRREAKLPAGWDLASPRPAGLQSWGNTSTLRTRNWKSENWADSPQGSQQLHGGRRPPALASHGEPSPREAVFAHVVREASQGRT